jgi:hypothetical protein
VAELRFTWDQPKAAANVSKHGVSFEEAQWVFYDEHALVEKTLSTLRMRTDSSSSVSAARCGSYWSSTASPCGMRFASSALARQPRRSRGNTWSG